MHSNLQRKRALEGLSGLADRLPEGRPVQPLPVTRQSPSQARERLLHLRLEGAMRQYRDDGNPLALARALDLVAHLDTIRIQKR